MLDEPEAALSLHGQLAVLRRMYELCRAGSQFVIATHSPMLLAYPGALIYELTENGLCHIAFLDTQQYQLTKSFLDNPDAFLRHLLSD